MHLEFVRVVSILFGFLRVLTTSAVRPAQQEHQLRFGLAAAVNGEMCVALDGPGLPAQTRLTVIDQQFLPRVFTLVVDAPVQKCPLLNAQEIPGTQYHAHLAEGDLPNDRLVGIAVVGAFLGHGGPKNFTLDLGADLHQARMSTCTSGEGIYLSLWSAAPRRSTLLWQAYWYLGFDTEPTCTRADYQPPTRKLR